MNTPSSDKQDECVIRGIVQRVTFRNPDNGYSVIQLTVPDQAGNVTVVGNCLNARVGADLIVRGVYNDHPKFGRQLTARSITETTPSTPEGLERYLSSGLVKGIGEKTAARIVQQFGAQTLDVIHKDPKRLAKIPGVGKKKAAMISRALAEQADARGIMQFLLEHNISPRLATKIRERYGTRAVELLSRDPYILARDLRGVGFLTADTIALNLGLKPESSQRLRAGIYHALEKATEDGHCFLTQEMLAQRARSLLSLSDDQDLSPHLSSLIEDDYVVRQGERIYLKHLFNAEEFVAQFVARRLEPLDSPLLPNSHVEAALKSAEQALGLTFSEEQRQAVLAALRHRLTIITGGPGCGKTTIIRALAAVFSQAHKRLYLCAPTGRAAQRMAQVTELPASTIHRMLKFDPTTGGFVFGPGDQLPADAVIVDEASMIDILLARDLFAAIPSEATVILVGDRDQLPSVGPGRVFGDLISVPQVRTIALSKLFRRAGESSINNIAHMINAGLMPEIPQPDGVTKVDAYFIPRSEADEAGQTIEALMHDQITKKFGIPREDICVLTPSNRGPLGTQVLNERLQNRLNPESALDSEQILTVGTMTFRVGDRVCQRINNYQIDDAGVFNGDLGHIYAVDKQSRSLTVDMWDGRLIKYDSSEVGQLSLAYAMSVHRAQGSEIPCVILALHDSHYSLLERQLIYTAVTRAKKLLVVVGSKRALSIGCKRTSTKRRACALAERIIQRAPP